ncbi:hypothetical protein GGS21DRAFT_239123 [Xylaria nigripes]|nr:hypothetical protein GGS21DRAFT_239123 [Xylaria nigripes]
MWPENFWDSQNLAMMRSPHASTYNMPPTSPGPERPPSRHKPRKPRKNARPYRRKHEKSARHPNHSHHDTCPSEHSHHSKHPFGVGKNHWQSTEALELVLNPRSFDELHAERVYILSALQLHDRRALELLRRIPVLEEQISKYYQYEDHDYDQYQRKHQGMNERQRIRVNEVCVDEEDKKRRGDEQEELRKACRQRLWVRQQIEDTVDAERNLLTRLSELHVEIQCRERWHQVECERAYMPRVLEAGNHELGLGYPCFQHQQCCQNMYWNSQLQENEYLYRPESHGPEDIKSEYGHGQGPYHFGIGCEHIQPLALYSMKATTGPGNREHQVHRLEGSLECKDEGMRESVSRERLSVRENRSDVKTRVRRWSFPSVHYEWAEEHVEAHRCVGYLYPRQEMNPFKDDCI